MTLARLLAAALCVAVSPALAAPTAAESEHPAARRIVTLAPHLAELVHAAGAGERLVGASEWSDYPPGVEALPRVGSAFQVDLERLAALSPDLVLGWEGGNPARVLEQLAQHGYRVVALPGETLDDVAAQIERIGELAGTGARAAQSAARYRAELAALRLAQAGKPALGVFYQVSWRPLYTVGGRQVISQVIELCGGRNVFGDQAAMAPAIGLEAVIARQPEVILGTGPAEDLRQQWQRWPGIPAVAGGHVYTLPGDLLARPSPRILEGARALCAALDRARGGALD